MNKKLLNNKRSRIILALIVGFLVLLLLLIFTASSFRKYGQIKLSTNNKTIFSYEDLVIDNLKYGSIEIDIKKHLGSPKEIKDESKGIYKYRILSYEGIAFTLKENYDDYSLVKVETTSSNYTFSRGIRVGKRITNVFDEFKVENSSGAYLYGNYKKESLIDKSIKDNIYFGLRSNENVLFVNRDSVVDDLPTNIATLNIEYSYGTINKITWSYDIE